MSGELAAAFARLSSVMAAFSSAMTAAVDAAVEDIATRPGVVSFAWLERRGVLGARVVHDRLGVIEESGGGKLDVLSAIDARVPR